MSNHTQEPVNDVKSTIFHDEGAVAANVASPRHNPGGLCDECEGHCLVASGGEATLTTDQWRALSDAAEGCEELGRQHYWDSAAAKRIAAVVREVRDGTAQLHPRTMFNPSEGSPQTALQNSAVMLMHGTDDQKLDALQARPRQQEAPEYDEAVDQSSWLVSARRIYLLAGESDEESLESAQRLWGYYARGDEIDDPYEAALDDIAERGTHEGAGQAR